MNGDALPSETARKTMFLRNESCKGKDPFIWECLLGGLFYALKFVFFGFRLRGEFFNLLKGQS